MYATGKKAWGISDRSGVRYRLRDMRKEWTGALVGPDEYDPKHPQLYPPKVSPDPQALKNPRPDPEEGHVYVNAGDWVFPPLPNLAGQITGSVGRVTVTTS
jgi:hypothetical protein